MGRQLTVITPLLAAWDCEAPATEGHLRVRACEGRHAEGEAKGKENQGDEVHDDIIAFLLSCWVNMVLGFYFQGVCDRRSGAVSCWF